MLSSLAVVGFMLVQSPIQNPILARYDAIRASQPNLRYQYTIQLDGIPSIGNCSYEQWGENNQRFTMDWNFEKWSYVQVGHEAMLVMHDSTEYESYKNLDQLVPPEGLNDGLVFGYPAFLKAKTLNGAYANKLKPAGNEVVAGVIAHKFTAEITEAAMSATIWLNNSGNLLKVLETVETPDGKRSRTLHLKVLPALPQANLDLPLGYIPMSLVGSGRGLNTEWSIADRIVEGKTIKERVGQKWVAVYVPDADGDIPVASEELSNIREGLKSSGIEFAVLGEVSGFDSWGAASSANIEAIGFELLPGFVMFGPDGVVEHLWKGYASGESALLTKSFSERKKELTSSGAPAPPK